MTNFLDKMAKEVDLETPFVVEKPDELPGHIASHRGPGMDVDIAPKPEFDPMRRKLALKMGE